MLRGIRPTAKSLSKQVDNSGIPRRAGKCAGQVLTLGAGTSERDLLSCFT